MDAVFIAAMALVVALIVALTIGCDKLGVKK
jgi:hypothetical protein